MFTQSISQHCDKYVGAIQYPITETIDNSVDTETFALAGSPSVTCYTVCGCYTNGCVTYNCN